MPFKHQLLFVFLFLIHICAFSQDYEKYQHYGKGISDSTYKTKDLSNTNKPAKNSVRLGLYFTKATIVYDRAIKEKGSIGLEWQTHWGKFPGYSMGLLGRYYFKGFNQTNFFLEEKISYGHYNP